MKKITKIILLACMIVVTENTFAQWSFSMSVSYVGRDCGVANSYLSTINQRLRASSSEMQYSTKEQCMANRSAVQSVVNEFLNYRVSGVDCRVVVTLGGCVGNDMSSSTLQLGVSSNAAFQSSNPANEVDDWVAMHDSLVVIFGDFTRYEEPLAQTEHIKDFIGGLDQIDHVGTSGRPLDSPVLPDNVRLATDHEAPSFDWDNVYNKKEEEIILPLTRKRPAIPLEGEYVSEPVSFPQDDSQTDKFWYDFFDMTGDATALALDIYQIVKMSSLSTPVGILADYTIQLTAENLKAFYQTVYHGLWKGEPVILSTTDILTNAARNTAIGTITDVTSTFIFEGKVKVEEGLDASEKVAEEVFPRVLEITKEIPNNYPLGSMMSIATQAIKTFGKILGRTDPSEEY